MIKIKKNKSIREKVYDALKKMIVEEEIAPGERIIETDYSDKFQISRTPIREAIRMLELEGLVINSATGGVRVRQITEAEIKEVYKIRIALEGLVIEEVIEKITPRDVTKFEDILANTEKEILSGNIEQVNKLFGDFNFLLYKTANLPKVEAMINNLNLYTKKFRRISIDDSVRKLDAFHEHRELLEFIKAKDLDKALKLNRIHLEKSMDIATSLTK